MPVAGVTFRVGRVDEMAATAGITHHSLDVDRRDLRAKADGSTLEVLVDDDWISFVDVGPKRKAAELAELLQTDAAAAT